MRLKSGFGMLPSVLRFRDLLLGLLLAFRLLSGRLLLVLALALLSNGLLKNLQNLLIGNLLVGLELGEIRGRGCAEASDTVLGDGCNIYQ